MRWQFCAGLLAFLRVGLSQAQPDITDILKKVSATYKAVSQYDLVIDATGGAPGAREHVSVHMRFAFKAPDKYRMEGSLPGMAPDNPEYENATAVFDGSTLWWYLPKINQYASIPADDFDVGGDSGDMRPEAMDQFMLARYRGAPEFPGGAKFLRNESIDVGGARVDCHVVMVGVSGESPYTWWVDRKSYRIVREDHEEASAVFTSIKLGEPLAEDLFRFVPPAGAKKMERQ
jgi:outer membrane lipoprotein-sorting protein